MLIRNERLHSILWIAQCFWWNAKVELCVLWPPVVFCTWAAPSVRGAEINRNHSLMSFGVALRAFPLGKCRWVCLRLTWKRRDVQDTSGRWSAGQADAVTAWQICPWNNGCQCLDEHSVILQQFFFFIIIKFEVSKFLLKKWILVFSKETWYWSKVTVQTFIMLQKISVSNKYCSFELYANQSILEKFIKVSTKCFLSSKSAFQNDF